MALLEQVQPKAVEVPASNGSYFCFSDPSGAQLWMQVNAERELIGMNPHFDGPSRRLVRLTRKVERDSSPLDGGFYGWANPTRPTPQPSETPDEDAPAEGDYPFAFDVPDFRVLGPMRFPHEIEVQLVAFASDDFAVFDDEDVFADSQEGEVKFASQSFIPTGLFTNNEEGEHDSSLPPQPFGLFAGVIAQCEKRQNGLTGEKFWWIAVDTLGGPVDVVVDADAVLNTTPRVGGVVSGSFFLSGRVMGAPKPRFSWTWKRGR